ncbi:MAG: ECF transporter S component, partial [Lachnospiraceae bacterium]|nr:ECF transporter S component [Lachnospiraceae bacterium]
METKEKIRYVLLTLFCILLNYFGRQLAVRMQLPLWLDVVGTILAAYSMGPVHGAVVGLTNNLINALWEPAMLYYAVVSVVIGLVAGYAGKKKYINSFLMAMTVAVGITLLSVLISTPISLLIGEVDDNIWGRGVRDYFLELNLPRVLATGIGNLYVEFLD